MPADAYFHVYLVNASAKPVHFDNMSIRVIKANTLETMNYYPFGLRWEKHDPESTNNKVWHHGKELQENEFLQQGKSLDLEDFGARMYDPAIGRWWSPDPLAEMFISMTPYCSFGNNPLYFIDPDGRKITETDSSFKFTGNDALRLLGLGAPKDPPKKDPAKKNETPLMLQNPRERESVSPSTWIPKPLKKYKPFEVNVYPLLTPLDFGIGFYSNYLHDHLTYRSTKGKRLSFQLTNGKYRETAQATKYRHISYGIRGLSTGVSIFSTGYSAYRLYEGTGNTMDAADVSVGTFGLLTSAGVSLGIVSNPIGWGVGVGTSIYGGARFLGDLIGDYKPEGNGVGQYYDHGIGLFVIK